jgi:hypothetical protein
VTRQVVILAHATDTGASSVAARLAARIGSARVRVVRPELLGLARWSHRVGARGRASTRIALPRSETLASEGVAAVFNRIRYLSLPRFRLASAKDRDYAGAELHAVIASWLAEFGDRAIHDVRRRPWVTPFVSEQEWVSAAAACNLPVAPRRIDSFTGTAAADHPCRDPLVGTVLVAGGTATGELATEFGARCVVATQAIGLPLLEFHFVGSQGATVLAGVDPLPPLVDSCAAGMVSALLATLAGGAAP